MSMGAAASAIRIVTHVAPDQWLISREWRFCELILIDFRARRFGEMAEVKVTNLRHIDARTGMTRFKGATSAGEQTFALKTTTENYSTMHANLLFAAAYGYQIQVGVVDANVVHVLIYL
jgi:hypothetical protein